MKIDIKQIQAKLLAILKSNKKYLSFMLVILFLLLSAFLVLRINQFSHQEPDQDAVAEKLQTVSQPKIDQSVLDKIQQLQDQNVEAKSLFQQARDNPFNE